MHPTRFLRLAKLLRDGPPDAENYRTAISRAYYAAYHAGREALLAIGIRPSEGPAGHGDVVKCLGGCGDPVLARAGTRLQDLHGRRRKADYSLGDPTAETRAEAQTACLEADHIIGLIDVLLNDPAKAFARSEMKRVARDTLKMTVT